MKSVAIFKIFGAESGLRNYLQTESIGVGGGEDKAADRNVSLSCQVASIVLDKAVDDGVERERFHHYLKSKTIRDPRIHEKE